MSSLNREAEAAWGFYGAFHPMVGGLGGECQWPKGGVSRKNPQIP